MQSWFLSSSGSGGLSLTLKGLLTALVPLTLTVFKHYGIDLPQDDLVNAIDAVVAAVAAVLIVVGLIRKIGNRIAEHINKVL